MVILTDSEYHWSAQYSDFLNVYEINETPFESIPYLGPQCRIFIPYRLQAPPTHHEQHFVCQENHI